MRLLEREGTAAPSGMEDSSAIDGKIQERAKISLFFFFFFFTKAVQVWISEIYFIARIQTSLVIFNTYYIGR